MNQLSNWQTALLTSWAEVWASFLGVLPTILGAIFVFAIGLIIAYWLKKLVTEILKAVKFSKVSEALGIDDYLKKADFKVDLTHVVGLIVEWLVILVFFLAVVDILGLSAVSSVLTRGLGYI